MRSQAVICRIIGKRRTRLAIKSWIERIWSTECIVKFLPKNFFTVVFASEEDRNKLLLGEVWMFEDSPLYIQPWAPNFNPLKCFPYDSSIWVRLYNLSMEYWNEECLDKIWRSLGTLIEVDEDISNGDQYVYMRMKLATVVEIPRKIGLVVSGQFGFKSWKSRRPVSPNSEEGGGSLSRIFLGLQNSFSQYGPRKRMVGRIFLSQVKQLPRQRQILPTREW
ncbi:hypothetical protein SUGI_0138300 [Cryptomeria japonica]|nr:hypothetical protein SUGI_0138300 [Cryptomeria japonica]